MNLYTDGYDLAAGCACDHSAGDSLSGAADPAPPAKPSPTTDLLHSAGFFPAAGAAMGLAIGGLKNGIRGGLIGALFGAGSGFLVSLALENLVWSAKGAASDAASSAAKSFASSPSVPSPSDLVTPEGHLVTTPTTFQSQEGQPGTKSREGEPGHEVFTSSGRKG